MHYLISVLRLDLRHAVRSLARTPGVTAAVVGMLALGIGANAAMFGILGALLLSPPPHIRDASHVVRLWVREKGMRDQLFTIDGVDFTSYAALSHLRTASEVTGYRGAGPERLGRGARSEEAAVSFVSGSYFGFLGVQPRLGRLLGPADDSASAPPAAVIGYDYWRRRFAGRRSALGATFTLSDVVYTVVGVAPEGFSGAEADAADIWIPIQIAGPADHGPNWAHSWSGGPRLSVLVRPRPGVAPVAVADEATTALRAVVLTERFVSDSNPRVIAGSILPDRTPDGVSETSRLPLVVAGIALIVLLIACANTTNLLLLKGAERRREIAVRRALGASPWMLARLLAVESLVLSAAAGVAAVLVAALGTRLLQAALLPRYQWAAPGLSLRVGVFAVGTALLVGLLVSTLPIWQAGRADAVADLRAGARAARRARSPARTALLVVQSALSLALLVGTALFLRSFRDARATDLGFDYDHLITIWLNRENMRDRTPLPEATVSMLADRVRLLPGVSAVAVSTSALMYSSTAIALRIPGFVFPPRSEAFYFSAVSPDFFDVAGLAIVQGRGFTEADGQAAAKVSIVNASLAQAAWPGKSPLGQCLMIGPNAQDCTTVVGVVEDAKERGIYAFRSPQRQYYLPIQHDPLGGVSRSLLVRTRGSPPKLVTPIAREVASLFPDLPPDSVRDLSSVFARQLRRWRLGSGLFGAAAALALLLAAVGLYSVVAFGVRMREQEFGVRRALGAETWDLVRTVLWRSFAPVGVGVVVGAAFAYWAGRFVAPLLFEGHKPRDPLAFAGAAAVLLLASLAASLIPARLAARVDPRVALQAE